MNFPLGMLTGALAALILAYLVDDKVGTEFTKLYTYLFSALISLFAAGIALSGVLANLNFQSLASEEKRNRDLLATKAMLPLALSELCTIASEGMRICWEIQETANDPVSYYDRRFERLNIGQETLSVLRDTIALADDNTSARIQDMLREYQVFSARTIPSTNDHAQLPRGVRRQYREHTVGWAYFYALVSTMFDYSRGEVEEVIEGVDSQSIWSALGHGLGYGSRQTELLEMVDIYSRHFSRNYA